MSPIFYMPQYRPCCRILYGKIFLWIVAAFLTCLFHPQDALALPPQRFVIQQPEIAIESGMLYVKLSLNVDNEDGLRDMLKDGAVLDLSVSTTLERKRWWSNEEIVSSEFVATILHDPLTRDFVVLLPGTEGQKQVRDKNLTRLLHSTWRSLSLPVLSLTDLLLQERDAEYSLILNVSLQHAEVPPWLENSLVFWSSKVVPSEKIVLPLQMPGAQYASERDN